MKKLLFILFLLPSFSAIKPVCRETSSEILKTVEEVMTVLQTGASLDYIGEPVSQLEHALQCAQKACDAGADQETIIAALLHDIGHICDTTPVDQMGDYGVLSHEKIGAQFVLNRGFSHKVAELINGHVQAKRYFIYKDPDYYQALSPASIQTLAYQGGGMCEEEAKAFERDPLFKEKLQIRRWDEAAKIVGAPTAPLNFYEDLLINHLENQSICDE